jgi:hypothetical protein
LRKCGFIVPKELESMRKGAGIQRYTTRQSVGQWKETERKEHQCIDDIPSFSRR